MGGYHTKRNSLTLIIFLLLFILFPLAAALYFLKLDHYLLVPTTLLSLFFIGVLLSIYIPKLRILTINFTVLIGLILISEVSLFLSSRIFTQNQHIGTYHYRYFVPDPVLGYKINPIDKIYTSSLKSGKNIIYDVTYHINENGFRVTPVFKPNQPCVWFVGDSFTFGEGVNDSESLPYSWADHKKINAVNFGVHGYGPHQVLRFLEQIKHQTYTQPYCQPNYVFLQLLPEHISRIIGGSSWDKNGPWFDLDNQGHLYLKGHFSDKPNKNKNIYLQKSDLAQYIESKITASAPITITPHHWAVYKQIIQAIDLQSKQLGSKLIIFLWDKQISEGTPAYTAETKKMLDSLNIHYILASSILKAETEAYFIQQDGHPNAKAYQTIAEKLYF